MAKRKAKETKVKAAPAKKAKRAKAAAAEPVVTTKVEREVRNGVKRPREGGLCAAVWADLDKLHASGTVPTAQHVRDLSEARGWNVNNGLTELSQWRRWQGLSKGRVIPKRKRAQAKVAAPAVRVDGEVDQQTA